MGESFVKAIGVVSVSRKVGDTGRVYAPWGFNDREEIFEYGRGEHLCRH